MNVIKRISCSSYEVHDSGPTGHGEDDEYGQHREEYVIVVLDAVVRSFPTGLTSIPVWTCEATYQCSSVVRTRHDSVVFQQIKLACEKISIMQVNAK